MKNLFAKLFTKKNEEVALYKVTYEYFDGTSDVIVMDGKGVNCAMVHDYDGQIVKVEKI